MFRRSGVVLAGVVAVLASVVSTSTAEACHGCGGCRSRSCGYYSGCGSSCGGCYTSYYSGCGSTCGYASCGSPCGGYSSTCGTSCVSGCGSYSTCGTPTYYYSAPYATYRSPYGTRYLMPIAAGRPQPRTAAQGPVATPVVSQIESRAVVTTRPATPIPVQPISVDVRRPSLFGFFR